MQYLYITVGIPSAGKNFWANNFQKQNPNTKIVCRDNLRIMLDNYVFSQENEKFIRKTRDYLIREILKKGCDCIVADTGFGTYSDMVKIAKSLEIDCIVQEKCFYIEVEEAIMRDAKRTGYDHIGEEVIRKFWEKSGKQQFKHYKPKTTTLLATDGKYKKDQIALAQDVNLECAVICDIDGSYALVGNRSPYDASESDKLDSPNTPVVETVKLYQNAGYQIIFCSGREDKYEVPTRNFIEQHLGNNNYKLFMRKSNDFRKDSIIKNEIYVDNIKDKYNVLFVIEDRRQVVELWRDDLGLTVFQVDWGEF